MQVAKKRPTLFDDKPVYQADNLDWDTAKPQLPRLLTEIEATNDKSGQQIEDC